MCKKTSNNIEITTRLDSEPVNSLTSFTRSDALEIFYSRPRRNKIPITVKTRGWALWNFYDCTKLCMHHLSSQSSSVTVYSPRTPNFRNGNECFHAVGRTNGFANSIRIVSLWLSTKRHRTFEIVLKSFLESFPRILHHCEPSTASTKTFSEQFQTVDTELVLCID